MIRLPNGFLVATAVSIAAIGVGGCGAAPEPQTDNPVDGVASTTVSSATSPAAAHAGTSSDMMETDAELQPAEPTRTVRTTVAASIAAFATEGPPPPEDVVARMRADAPEVGGGSAGPKSLGAYVDGSATTLRTGPINVYGAIYGSGGICLWYTGEAVRDDDGSGSIVDCTEHAAPRDLSLGQIGDSLYGYVGNDIVGIEVKVGREWRDVSIERNALYLDGLNADGHESTRITYADGTVRGG